MRIVNAAEMSRDQLEYLLTRPDVDAVEVTPEVMARTEETFGGPLTPLEVVQTILADVRERGDEALVHYAAAIDGVDLSSKGLFVTDAELEQAYQQVSKQFLADLDVAMDNIAAYHRKQVQNSWITTGPHGNVLGQKVTPLASVGAYVPGGTAPLVSTVLMTVVPAKVAGVKRVVVATPETKHGGLNPHIIVAAHKAGASQLLRVGGAQGIAALAYGTQSVEPVDKIVGPGNIYVTLAKKEVFGKVGIDSLAGPSEILVIADDTANPRYVAADLLSQAEHDPEAGVYLLTTSPELAEQVAQEIKEQLALLPRREIAAQALTKSGVIVVCPDLETAAELSNICAPEHLELAVAEPFALLDQIQNAGAIFLGHYASEPVGDYVAGPNHVLPTNGTARFSSPLGVYDFVKYSSIISVTAKGLQQLAPTGIRLAQGEGLQAHARAMAIRFES